MTIRLRLTIYWAAVLAAILLIAAIAVVKLFERQQFSALDAALLQEAQNTADQIERGGASSATGILQRLSLETDIGPGRRVRIVTAHGEVGNYGDIHTIPPPFDTRCRPGDRRQPRVQVRGRAVDVQRPARVPSKRGSGGPGRGIGRQPAQPAAADGSDFAAAMRRRRLSAGGPGAAAVETVAAELDAIGPTNLSSRLTVPPEKDEVARLTAEINSLLERLERASATERRFASDAAHELRTPLAVLRTGLEVALARERTPEQNRAALGAAHREALSLCRIADELLMLSRLNGEAMVDRHKLNLRALLTRSRRRSGRWRRRVS